MISDDLLRRDVHLLGDLLGTVITKFDGAPAFDLVEHIRRLARERRAGSDGAQRDRAEHDLAGEIAGLDDGQARTVARAFSIYFDLANIAEDRQRVRVLREREQQRDPAPISESVAAGIAELKRNGLSAERVQEILDRLAIELVFTAHPSEAKRRSIRAKLRRMRQALKELDAADLVPRERLRLEDRLRSELSVLWQTDFLRPVRPSVLDEVDRGLSIMPRIWDVVPQIYQAIRRSLAEQYPGHAFRVPIVLRFGSWMGGDRDGNPNVTADITAQTLCRLRNAAIGHHLGWCKTMYDHLTISRRAAPRSAALEPPITAALAAWPELAKAIDQVAPQEIYRRWVRLIEWRLKQSLTSDLSTPPLPGAYAGGQQFEADVRALCDALVSPGQPAEETDAQRWLDLVRVFGLHLTRLDIRQDSRRYQEVLSEIFKAIGAADNFAALDEAAQAKLLTDTIDYAGDIPREGLAPLTLDTLALYQLWYRAASRFGNDCLGCNVISLTQSVNDVLSVLWLWRWAKTSALAQEKSAPSEAPSAPVDDLKIVPLFEKIGDLQRAPQTLTAMLEHPLYGEYLARQGNRQVIMVGYSDSTKDGGYLAASWGLYQAQSDLQKVADAHDVRLTFFHGRGGSLGRGGGPAARGILSLPGESLDGTLRLTEQGEVLSERYDDVTIAYRHLEQVTWATLVGSSVRREQADPRWLEVIERLSQESLKSYRELVDQPGFMQFFVTTTPLEEIEQLPIGSRPARRRGERTLGDLRAIPWVFSWTQNRCMIPAWYGLGAALESIRERDPEAWRTIEEMYAKWAFFRATIDNAALALVKADMYVAGQYATLVEPGTPAADIWKRVVGEFGRTRQALVALAGGDSLLPATPWLERSIEVRNPYIDPLNLIQVELMKRRRARPAAEMDPAEAERLRDLMRLTVQGIAAGMRTTG